VTLILYAADRAGECWHERECLDPLDALTAVRRAREQRPDYAWGVFDDDDPEHGDVEDELDEAIEEVS
jgi:hypothetical protein